MEEQERTELLRAIRDEIVNLKESPLYSERVKNQVHPVIGEGNHRAKIMFVGEAPGRTEAQTGRPFVGAAGKILDQLLEAVDIGRQEVYITNIVKDRPPFNRDPLPSEIEAYGPFLDRQIEIIQPRVIATLGRFAMTYIMQKMGLGDVLEPISRAHGKSFIGRTSYGEIIVVPLYHPAVAVYNSNTKETLKKDFEILKKYA